MLTLPPVAVVVALAATGCAASPASDVPALRAAQEADRATSEALARVDALVAKGRGAEAIAELDGPVKAALERASERAEAAHPRSEWGKARRLGLEELVGARKRAISRYRSAIEGDDLQKVVEAMEEQKLVERRAAALAAELASPPGG